MAQRLALRLSEIQVAQKAELRRLWQQDFPDSSPPNLNRNMLAAILAYKLQEQAFGSVSADLIAQLRRAAKTFEANPEGSPVPMPSIKPGTRLVRRWKDGNHQVTVESGGFEYRGTRYESLSEIARIITGTRWSGPLFFGLRGKKTISPKVQHAK